MTLARKLLLAFVLLSLLAIGTMSVLAIQNAQNTLETNTRNHITAMNELKEQQFVQWLASNEYSLQRMAQRPLVIQDAYVMNRVDDDDIAYWDAYVDLRDNHLTQLVDEELGFDTLFVLSPETGHVIASSDERQVGRVHNEEDYFVLGRENIAVQNPYYLLSEERSVITISAPLKQANTTVGVLAGHLDLAVANGIMAQGFFDHKTGETFLVNKFNFFVTQSRHSLTSDTHQTVYTEGVQLCLQGASGTHIYENQRQVTVLGAYRWMPEQELCIITEIEAQEAFASITRLRDEILLGSGLVLVAAVISSLLFARSLIQPIQHLVEDTRIIGKGDLTHRVANRTSQQPDEIGELARSFDQMLANLQQVTASRDDLDREIEERKQVEEALRETSMALIERFKELSTLRDISIYEDEDPSEDAYMSYVAKVIPDSMQYPDICLCAIRFEDKVYGDAKVFDLTNILSRDIGFNDIVVGEVVVGYTQDQGFLEEEIPHLAEIAHRIASYVQRERTLQALKETLEDLRTSNQELQQFAYVASHDLQEPLRMVSSYMQLLERYLGDDLDDKSRQYMAFAVDGANRMKILINDLLAYSRATRATSAFARVDMNEIIQVAMQHLAPRITETQANIIVDDDLPSIFADQTQMQQVMMNIVNNAIKYHGDEPPLVHITACKEKDFVHIKVSDNGIGIAPEYHEQIFEIFKRLHTRAEYDGTGIGLAICKRIVERHGGRIWVESAPKQGTTMHFTIPNIHGL
jgi:signal transduction histidine kinase